MERISVGFMAGALPESWMVLAGENPEPGLLGCERRLLECGPDNTREQLVLSLRAAHILTAASLARLEGMLAEHRDWAAGGNGRRLWLRVLNQGAEAYAYCPIERAVLDAPEGLPLAMARGAFQLSLQLEREAFFVGAEMIPVLSNRLRSAANGDLRLDNHDDAGHVNWCSLGALELQSDLAQPLRILLRNSGSAAWRRLWLGTLNCTGAQPALCLQAEAGEGGSVQALDSASGGAFVRYSWSGTSWQQLAGFAINAVNLEAMAGKAYKPLLRLTAPLNKACRLRISLRLGSETLYCGSPVRLEAGAGLAVLPVLRLPPWKAGEGGLPASLTLSLEGLAEDAAACVLDLDNIQLLPVEGLSELGFRGGLEPGGSVTVDSVSRKATLAGTAVLEQVLPVKRTAHLAQRGQSCRLYLWMEGVDGKAGTELQASVTVWLRPAWRLR